LWAAAIAAALLSGACRDRDRSTPDPVRHWRSQKDLVIRLETPRDRKADEIEQLIVRPDTTLYALFAKEGRVRLFNPAGRVIRIIGGDSVGFQVPAAMGWLQPELWVYDAGPREVLVFDRTGNHTSSMAVPLSAFGADSVSFVALLINRSPLVRTWTLPVDTAPASLINSTLVRLRNPPAPPDTLLRLQDRDHWLVVQDPERPDTQPVRVRQPFADAAYIAPSTHDGMLVIVEATPPAPDQRVLRVTKINVPGDTLFSNRIAYQPRPLRSIHVRRMVDRIASEVHPAAPASRTRALKRSIERALYKPRTLPTATGLVIATDGTILIRREDTGADSVTWTVISPTGTQVATQSTPARTRFMTAGGPYLFGAERDSAGVMTIVRYRALER
jgi:hypothetical protein